MICPKCGTAIDEGYMYCPKCGEEVIMVPDYEVELEEGIEQTISEVVELMADSVEGETDNISVSTGNSKNKISLKIKLLIAAVIAVGLVLVIGITYLVKQVKAYYSFDEQFEKASEEFKDGDYEEAVKTARHVISINADDEKARLLLADSYFSLKKYDESIAVLNDLMCSFNSVPLAKVLPLANFNSNCDIILHCLDTKSSKTRINSLVTKYSG
jgi:uncharacterized membrane protein YvbJ